MVDKSNKQTESIYTLHMVDKRSKQTELIFTVQIVLKSKNKLK